MTDTSSIYDIPDEFKLSDEEFGWMQTERHYGSTKEEQDAYRYDYDLGTYLSWLRSKLEADPELRLIVYTLIGLRDKDGTN